LQVTDNFLAFPIDMGCKPGQKVKSTPCTDSLKAQLTMYRQFKITTNYVQTV